MVKERSSQSVGKIGEEIALDFLRKKGYKIIETNFYTHWGEIDIIAEKKEFLVFIEVKTRIGTKFGYPHEAISFYKLRALKRACEYYKMTHPKTPDLTRIDVVSIILKPDLKVEKIEVFENAQ